MLRWAGWGLLGLAAVFILAAWVAAWSDYQEEVRRQRFVWGPDAQVPALTPARLFDPDTLPLLAVEFYVCSFAAAVPGLVCLILARRTRPPIPDSVVPTAARVGRPDAG